MLGKFAVTRAVYSDVSGWGLVATFNNDWLVAFFRERDAALEEQAVGYPYCSVSKGRDNFHININEMQAVWAWSSGRLSG